MEEKSRTQGLLQSLDLEGQATPKAVGREQGRQDQACVLDHSDSECRREGREGASTGGMF